MTLPSLPMAMGSAGCVPFTPSARYPDPAIEVLDERFLKLRLFSAGVEQLATGLRWAEGPVWFGDGRYLLVSDIPNNRILRWDETSGVTSVFRAPSEPRQRPRARPPGPADRLRAPHAPHHAHRIRRPHHGAGRPLRRQAPEFAERHRLPRDGSVWFTDPSFGIGGHWEGDPAESELPHAVYRLDPPSGELQQVHHRPGRRRTGSRSRPTNRCSTSSRAGPSRTG